MESFLYHLLIIILDIAIIYLKIIDNIHREPYINILFLYYVLIMFSDLWSKLIVNLIFNHILIFLILYKWLDSRDSILYYIVYRNVFMLLIKIVYLITLSMLFWKKNYVNNVKNRIFYKFTLLKYFLVAHTFNFTITWGKYSNSFKIWIKLFR